MTGALLSATTLAAIGGYFALHGSIFGAVWATLFAVTILASQAAKR